MTELINFQEKNKSEERKAVKYFYHLKYGPMVKNDDDELSLALAMEDAKPTKPEANDISRSLDKSDDLEDAKSKTINDDSGKSLDLKSKSEATADDQSNEPDGKTINDDAGDSLDFELKLSESTEKLKSSNAGEVSGQPDELGNAKPESTNDGDAQKLDLELKPFEASKDCQPTKLIDINISKLLAKPDELGGARPELLHPKDDKLGEKKYVVNKDVVCTPRFLEMMLETFVERQQAKMEAIKAKRAIPPPKVGSLFPAPEVESAESTSVTTIKSSEEQMKISNSVTAATANTSVTEPTLTGSKSVTKGAISSVTEAAVTPKSSGTAAACNLSASDQKTPADNKLLSKTSKVQKPSNEFNDMAASYETSRATARNPTRSPRTIIRLDKMSPSEIFRKEIRASNSSSVKTQRSKSPSTSAVIKSTPETEMVSSTLQEMKSPLQSPTRAKKSPKRVSKSFAKAPNFDSKALGSAKKTPEAVTMKSEPIHLIPSSALLWLYAGLFDTDESQIQGFKKKSEGDFELPASSADVTNSESVISKVKALEDLIAQNPTRSVLPIPEIKITAVDSDEDSGYEDEFGSVGCFFGEDDDEEEDDEESIRAYYFN